ncbi:hypothetical protein SAMN06265337_3787 [Hymenobacter gelipurpurascens]|uniref:Uncharacterized protein n=1 Tax=Hymenobacter gelipurpurascens TaxID=89968 RepID=A0A212UG49_9BACT|nr:hypothetical protein [Hymenobacter gelipurpurascens]SNC77205.1 hypothetical protein SAMN06265337_3787 [Hymenobacter gelipurpurascens]
MRFRLNLLFYPLLGLAACQPELNPGPRVDFVASSRFTTGNRRLTTPGDTVATRIYGQAQGGDSHLTQLKITATYQPVPEGIIYPQSGYEEGKQPTLELIYLDTLLPTTPALTKEFAFQSVQPARTTAGTEVWKYEFRDNENRTGSRSFQLRLGRTDSLITYHSYTIGLQAPLANSQMRRSFLALRSGLALPKFTVRRNVEAQQLIDLLYIPDAATGPGLATPSNQRVVDLKAWPTKRITRIRSTTLTDATFATFTTTEQLVSAFNAGTVFPSDSTYTGRVTKNQVIAFRTPEGKSGAILVQDITTTGVPTLVLQVRIAK